MGTEVVSREEVNSRLYKGVGGLAGGIGLLVLNGFGPLGSLVWGGLLAGVGLYLLSKKGSSLAGLVTLAAGGLALITLIPVIGGLSGFLLAAGGIGLLVAGALSLWRFITGLNSRR